MVLVQVFASQLGKLTERFHQPCPDLVSAQRLAQNVTEFEQGFDVLMALGEDLPAAAQTAAGRAVCSTLDTLAALNAALRQLLPASAPAKLQLKAACQLAARCCALVQLLPSAAGAPQHTLRACLRLVLDSGAAVLAEAAASVPAGSESEQEQVLELLAWQVEAAVTLTEAVATVDSSATGSADSSSGSAGSTAAAATAAAQQEAELAARWIDVAGAAIQRAFPRLREALLLNFSTICYLTCYYSSLLAWRQALEQRPAALSCLFQLMLSVLPAVVEAAAPCASTQPAQHEQHAAQRPGAGGGPPSHLWGPSRSAHLVQLLASHLLRPALCQLVSAADEQSQATIAALLQQAAQLVACMPAQPKPGQQHPDMVLANSSMVRLLGNVCSVLLLNSEDFKPSISVQRQQAQLLLPALPMLCLALQQIQQGKGLTAEQRNRAAATICENILHILQLLCTYSAAPVEHSAAPNWHPHPIATSLADVVSWLDAVASTLRLLPAVAQLAQQLPHAQDLRPQLRNARLPEQIANRVLQLCTHVALMAAGLTHSPPGSGSSQPVGDDAAMGNALHALYRYHSAMCRLVHWAAGRAETAALPRMGGRLRLVPLLSPLRHSLVASHSLWGCLSPHNDPDKLEKPPVFSSASDAFCFTAGKLHKHDRWLLAMHAAHWEALVVATASAAQPADWDWDAGGYAAHAVKVSFQRLATSGPATLLHSPALEAALLQSMQQMPSDLEHKAALYNNVLGFGTWSGRLATGILASGLLSRVVADLSQLMADRRMAESQVLQPAQYAFGCMAVAHDVATNVVLSAQGAPAPASGAYRSNAGTGSQAADRPSNLRGQQQPAADALVAIERCLHSNAAAVGEEVRHMRIRLGHGQAPTAQQVLAALTQALPTMQSLAMAMQQYLQLPGQRWADEQLGLASAAALRSCANLRCGNVELEGGPAAGQGSGCKKCGACRAVWYCSTACSHADWRAGHKWVCKALGAARQVLQAEAAGAEDPS